jgi:hypothetical protein
MGTVVSALLVYHIYMCNVGHENRRDHEKACPVRGPGAAISAIRITPDTAHGPRSCAAVVSGTYIRFCYRSTSTHIPRNKSISGTLMQQGYPLRWQLVALSHSYTYYTVSAVRSASVITRSRRVRVARPQPSRGVASARSARRSLPTPAAR